MTGGHQDILCSRVFEGWAPTTVNKNPSWRGRTLRLCLRKDLNAYFPEFAPEMHIARRPTNLLQLRVSV
jgi:hypothetical protein